MPAALGLAQVEPPQPTATQREFFEAKVRPLLAKNCYACHSTSKMGGLKMDTSEDMMKGGQDGPVLMPGKPDQSLLLKAVSYTDARLRMPPNGKLGDDDIAILQTWVKDGAVWGERSRVAPAGPGSEYVITPQQRAFWSFQPPRKLAPPEVRDASWVQSPIDRFILAKLEAKGLQPVRATDRRTLIRRATVDLLGLPPTPEEVDAFLNDKSPNAFSKVVDRLLASPQYGERWGRHWLDVARYSDFQLTAEGDRQPLDNAFQYRDWVVRAFNDDMPYDKFVKAQIAGDQLPEAERSRYVGGLGYYSLSPKPEFREERVDATARGFLGLTVACAECHNHKFDPIPTKDYYSLLGIFESTEPDKFPLAPKDIVDTYEKQKQALDKEQAVLQKFLTDQRSQLFDVFAQRTAEYAMAAWRVLGPQKKSLEDAALGGKGLERKVLERWIEFLAADRKREYASLDEWKSLLEKAGDEGKAQTIADQFQAYVLAVRTQQQELDAKNDVIKAQTKEGVSPKILPLERGMYYLLKDLQAEPAKKLGKSSGGPFFFSPDEVGGYLGSVSKDYFDTLRSRIYKLKAALPPEYAYYPVIKDKAKPENLHVYIRGNKETPGEEAPRQFLAILSPGKQTPFTKGSGRLELAESIADPKNPLTARVMVNRIWLHHFGAGLVGTPSNFGLLGEAPTNPELLDYLANRFVENGWSIKAMHREIMLSKTYALSSEYSEANVAVDPEAKLMWRVNARRMDVEAMRDSLLFVAGKLDTKIGGPAIPIEDEKNTRRTIYATISRAKPAPLLRLFDFPDPNETSERRIATNVPLQQLFFLNSDFVRVQAEALAKRIGSGPSERAAIETAYRILFGRVPTAEELRLGLEFLAGQQQSFASYLSALLSSNEFNYVN
jgi:hypothetical protein